MSDSVKSPAPATPLLDRLIVLGFALLLFGLLVMEVFRDYKPVKLGALLVFAYKPALLVLHEFGHAAMTWLVRWKVCGVVIGMGNPLLVFRVRGVPIEVRPYPIEGYVLPAPRSMRGVRLKHMLISLAGPGIELAALAIVVAWVGGASVLLQRSDDVGIIAAQAFAIAVIAGVIINMLPIPIAQSVAGETQWTDGLQTIMAWVRPRSSFEHSMVLPWTTEAERLQEAGKEEEALACYARGMAALPGNPAMRYHYAAALSDAGKHAAAREQLSVILENSKPEDPWWPAASHLLARVHLTLGGDDDLKRAEQLTGQAMEKSPKDPHLLTTRGAVMIELYRIHEGVDLLNQAMEAAKDPRMQADRDRCALYLALAEHRRGNPRKAWEQLSQLRHRGVKGRLIDRIEKEMKR